LADQLSNRDEVGTLRISGETPDGMTLNDGVVDSNLTFLTYDNLYVCDLSVFPSSPAVNSTLTLAAMAIRLATHLKQALSRLGRSPSKR
jgi:choline dehydrogenase-like flavoprotein